jgi:membrane protease YdiL (CAAX protease family)
MFLVPWLVARTAFQRKGSELGLQLGDARYGFVAVAIGLPVALAAAYLGSLDPAMQAEYPIARSAWRSFALIVATEGFYLVYYLGWEFLFRGWMLMGLERRLGALPAILVQTIPSALAHIGKPISESFAAILAGLLFGYLAYRTRSILYPLLLHAAVGIGTDVFTGLRLA